MISINGLHVSYSGKSIIEGLDLLLEEGKIHAVAGLNGAGKTTLLNTIYGFIKPDKGTIDFKGRPLTKNDIAFLETTNFFYSRITGREHLELFRINNPAFNIGGWNELFELPLGQLVETYSTGMKKKLALMGVLSLNKPVFMLDEPFNGVDLESNQKIKNIIKLLGEKGKTIILTSHILESLTGLCDTIHYLNNKKIELSFGKEEFHSIEAKLFSLHNEKSQRIIKELLR